MKILSLFSGIGGLELGLEWAGLGVTRWQVEQDAFARQVLARHWPDAERFEDVREVTGADFPGCDVICGGFPCQDISVAGKGAGIDGERSGLWGEYARLVRELRPRLVIVENVAALAVRGLDRVLADLAALGYDAEWEVVSAADAGAPHLRKRIFIIAADPDSLHLRDQPQPRRQGSPQSGDYGAEGHDSNSHRQRSPARSRSPREGEEAGDPLGICGVSLAHSQVPGSQGLRGSHRLCQGGTGAARGASWWTAEPAVGRVAYGVSGRVDHLRCLGNAVVPQVAEVVGQRARLILDRGYVSDDAWELGHDSGG